MDSTVGTVSQFRRDNGAAKISPSNRLYAILFSTLSATTIGYAVVRSGAFLLLLWPAFSLAIVACAYFANNPRVFGKQKDGTMSWRALALPLPFLMSTWFVWHVLRRIRCEPAYQDLLPNVVIGRRLIAKEAAEMAERVDLVVDLTCEFPETRPLRRSGRYIAAPTLDASWPSLRELQTVVTACLVPAGQRVFIHCAEGHGRTGTVAACLLLAAGHASSAIAAVTQVQSRRPSVRLRSGQFDMVERYAHCLQSAIPDNPVL